MLVKGEGEGTILEIMNSDFRNLHSIAGLYLPYKSGWRLTRERMLTTNLDSYPWPKYEDISLSDYGDPYIGLVGSRGCLGNCVFCSDRLRLPGYRTRSANSRVEELEYLSSAFAVKHFPYYDALYNGDYALIEETSKEILNRRLQVDYSGNLMIRPSMSDDLLALMRKSGFSVAFIGLESGSATTLKAMRKRHNPEMASAFLKKCHHAGIRTGVNIIIGFPTETEEHFRETLDFISDNCKCIDFIVSVNSFILSGSEVYQRRSDFGIQFDDENDRLHGWYTNTHENTLKVRKERLQRFLDHIDSLGIKSEALISNENQLNRYGPYDISKIRSAFGIGDNKQPINPKTLAIKTWHSLRHHGFSETIRRGREWWTIQRNK